MTDTAVLDAPRTKEQDPDKKPKKQPPYAVIILNDNDHTVPYVVEGLQKVFKYELAKCHKLALEIHESGRAVVWSGMKEVAELKMDQIKSLGTDFYAPKPVKYPLGVVIEPLPE